MTLIEAQASTYLDDVILGSHPEKQSTWSQRTGRPPADIASVFEPEWADWSVGCNHSKIGPGTTAWIARFAGGGKPSLGGVLIVGGTPWEDPTDPDEWYVDGWLCGFRREHQASGAAIVRAGWAANQGPFGDKPRFTSGRVVYPADVEAIVDALDPVLGTFIADQYEKVNGTRPWWW